MDKGGSNASIESGWMDVREVLIIWMTHGPVLDGQDRVSYDKTEWAMMADDIPGLGMASWHEGNVNRELRWELRCNVTYERLWPQVEATSSQMIWPSVEASQWGSKRLSMHARAACVAEQAWIPHQLYSVGEEKPLLRVQRNHKGKRKMYIGLGSSLG